MAQQQAGSSPHRQTEAWKALHGAPPTPLPPRRDPRVAGSLGPQQQQQQHPAPTLLGTSEVLTVSGPDAYSPVHGGASGSGAAASALRRSFPGAWDSGPPDRTRQLTAPPPPLQPPPPFPPKPAWPTLDVGSRPAGALTTVERAAGVQGAPGMSGKPLLPRLDAPATHQQGANQGDQQWHIASLRSPDRAPLAAGVFVPGSPSHGAALALQQSQRLQPLTAPGSPGSNSLLASQQQQQQQQSLQRERDALWRDAQQRDAHDRERDRLQLAAAAAAAEARAAASERVAHEAAHAARLQQQHMVALSSDLARAVAEIGDLRGSRDAAAGAAAAAAEQLATVTGGLRRLEERLAEARGAAAEGGRAGVELRGQVMALAEQVVR